MSDSAQSMVERIKSRSTTRSVPERETSLADITMISEIAPSPPPQKQETRSIEQPNVNLIDVAARRQIRLEIALDEEIDTLCKKNKITPETLFESLYLKSKTDQDQLNDAIAEAKKRLSDRKRTGKIRRLQTQMKQENLEQF
jgi:hypothetical protein